VSYAKGKAIWKKPGGRNVLCEWFLRKRGREINKIFLPRGCYKLPANKKVQQANKRSVFEEGINGEEKTS